MRFLLPGLLKSFSGSLGKVSALSMAAVVLSASGLPGTVRESAAQATAVALTGTTYSQNFDGMGNTAGGSVPTGWGFFRSGTSTVTPAFTSGSTTLVTTQAAGTVGSTISTGGAYLWVTGSLTSGTDKAIGFLSSSSYPGPTSTSTGSSLALLFGFTNNSGGTITNLNLSWDYEKYRQGTRAFDWNFFTSTDGSTWTANSAGDQSYAADANSTTIFNPPTTASKSVSLSSLNVAAGQNYYLRWSYIGSGGWTNSQALGIDNFVMNATVAAAAANSYWDGGTGWTATSPGTGGDGTWADGTGGWNTADIANFGGTAGTVTTGSVSAGAGMAFSTSGYVLSGGTIALSAATAGLNSITTGSTTPFTTTINSVLTGSAGLTKLGAGTLVLGGNNTLTGTIAVSVGTLEIASDTALGDAATDISLGSTLKTTASVALASGRDIAGSGTLDIAPGTTLTSNGSFNLSSTTLANGGTLDLQGATRAVGLLTFGTAATVNGSGAITSTGISATAVTTGTAVVNPAITFSSGNKTVSIGAGGTLVLNGDLAGTTGQLQTNGGGRLVVSGSNGTGGFSIGSTGSSAIDGGTVVLGQAASSGTGQSFFNYGRLEAAVPMVLPTGLSIGGREGAVAIIGGTNTITFSGSSRFFAGFGATGPLRLDVNNATTFAGTFGTTGTSGAYTGITIGGTGSLAIDGNASALVDAITLQDSLDLLVGGTLGGSVVVGAGNLIGGNGAILGNLTLNAGADFLFEVGKTLIVNGSSVSFGDFGISDLVGFSSSTPDGIYTLIGGTATVSTANLRNLGPSNAVDLGDGRSAYLSTGSLELHVVPEPSTLALASLGAAAAGFASWRRVRRHRPR